MTITTREDIVKLMKHLNLPLVAAEVGVAEGIWSLHLLQLGIERIYLIDLWERVPFISGCASFEQEWHDSNYNAVIERTKDYKDKVVMLKGFSYKMAEQIVDNSCGLIYVDADHTYDGVKADIEAFWPKLVYGGIMAFHDFGNMNYGVNRAVQEFTKNVGVHHLTEDGNYVNWGCYLIKGEFDYGV